jgi:SAM-dependent methyltransferase
VNESLRIARDVVIEIAKNAAMAVPAVRAWRLRRPRSSAAFSAGDKQLERFAFAPLRQLLRLGVAPNGRHIAEIGPGDYLASGLAMLAAGASSYTAIERFPGDYRGADARAWYGAMERHWPRFFPDIAWPDGLSARGFPDNCAERVEIIAEPIERLVPKRRFDIVCSFQVGEHVSDLDVFAQMHRRLLAPDGIAVHRVDFAPHDRWEAYGDPLTFLRPRDWVWRLMGSHRGLPNRHRHHEFVAAFEAAGLTVETVEIETFDRARIDRSNAAKLAPRFRRMPEESLAVSAAVYRCRPAASRSATISR